MAKLSWKRKININRVVVKVIATVLGLYVGGFILVEIGNVLNGTSSAFYKGLSLIGYTVGYPPTNGTANWYYYCGSSTNTVGYGNVGTAAEVGNNCITATNGSGVLAVVGIIALASIVTEFVDFSM